MQQRGQDIINVRRSLDTIEADLFSVFIHISCVVYLTEIIVLTFSDLCTVVYVTSLR